MSTAGRFQNLVLEDVEETSKELGRGSYGVVIEVIVSGTKCAAKKIHSMLLQHDYEGRIMEKFEQEILLHSDQRHPNIVQLMGVYYPPDSKRIPTLIMEYLPFFLSNCLIKQELELEVKYSILHDVAKGLRYLHGKRPPIVHRDLTANNVLLTSSYTAKISDLGVSRLADTFNKQQLLTTTPGTQCAMPPEALKSNPVYNHKLDVFSYGCLILHVLTNEFPLPSEQFIPKPGDSSGNFIQVSEWERRSKYIKKIPKENEFLPLAKRCLANDPKERPEMSELEPKIGIFAPKLHSPSVQHHGKELPSDNMVPPPAPPTIDNDWESKRNLEGIQGIQHWNSESTELFKDTQSFSGIPQFLDSGIQIPKNRFKACMVLAGVGDALGYKNGAYEFCHNGPAINNEVQVAGGVGNIKVNVKEWMVSDDTVMHIATAEALVSKWSNVGELYKILAAKYKECMHNMAGRAPEQTCRDSTSKLRPKRENGYFIPFNPRGGGCGAAMRSAPIGLLYNHPKQLDKLVAVSIESGRMTHNHPTGFLGSLATALFVSYAFQGKPLVEWGIGLMQTLDVAWKYIEKMERDVRENKGSWDYFKNSWERYLTDRGIDDGRSGPNFPFSYGPRERDRYYASISFAGLGGSSGHDAPMIAYDALLGCGDSWEELCSRAMFHGGDSDSTGIIAAACWGAMKGFEDVPECNYEKLEYRERLEKLGKQLHDKHTSI